MLNVLIFIWQHWFYRGKTDDRENGWLENDNDKWQWKAAEKDKWRGINPILGGGGKIPPLLQLIY